MTQPPKSPADSLITLNHLMGIQDSNHIGNVHGGIIMKLCDEAGAMAAVRHTRRTCVTVALDRMTFDAPIRIGNLVTFTAIVTWVGRTSIEAMVKVSAENLHTGETTYTNTAYLLYVALDENGKPTPAQQLLCETPEEKRRWEMGEERQAYRLKLRKQEESAENAPDEN